MDQKDSSGSDDSMPSVGMTTPVRKGVEDMTDWEMNEGAKKKKLGIKKVKKKPDMNISKGKLKSVTTPKSFSYLNTSVQKQTIRANNRALAQNLAKARQEIGQLKTEVHTLRSSSQEQKLELNRLKRLVGLKDDQIQVEVQQRIQDEMKDMGSLLNELTQSMINSSTYITKIHNKSLMYCSRRSSDSSLSVSLGNNQSLNRSSSRHSFKEIGNKDDLVARYLSKADECTAPPGGREASNYINHGSDKSLIAEQSMIDDDLYIAHPLVSVDETISEISPIEKAPTQPMSKLPQRILKFSENTTSIVDLDLETLDKSDESQKEVKGKEATLKVKDLSGKEKEKSRSKTNKRKDDRSRKEMDSGKTNDGKNSKSKDKEQESKVKRMEVEKMLSEKDSYISIDGDISAFGFGGNFAADLVSGSPITADKRDETCVRPKPTAPTNVETKQKENKKKETFVKSNANLGTNTKGKKNVDKSESFKGSVKVSKAIAKQKDDSSLSKMKRRNTYATDNPFVPKRVNVMRSPEKLLNGEEKAFDDMDATDNPFVPKRVNVMRSPEKLLNGEEKAFDDMENPFKPTKTLLRSPVHITVESATPDKKVDSLAFLARFRESLEKRPEESSPLPEPMFPNETTTYFDSEMELTAVIDSSNLLQTLKRSEKNSPVSLEELEKISMDLIDLSNDKSQNAINSIDETNAKSQHDSSETAAVEVRTKKPGVFTFSVGRKEADGSRKPVPEKISKARSKKKKPLTPEKEDRKIGQDRDMFNFGDRTPTVPLDKLAAKTKNVYDLSMNESVATVPVTLNNFKNKKNVPETEPDGQIYYAPLKGCSPDEKTTSKRTRSQSRSCSKSRKKNEDDEDDDWVPGGKSRGRSKSRSRKSDDDQTIVRRGRSKSRKRVVKETETDGIEEEKTRGRSKSRSRKIEKEERNERPSRSRSCRRAPIPDSDEDNMVEKIDEPLSKRCRSRSRGRALKDKVTEENNNKDEKVETETVQAEIQNDDVEKQGERSCRSKPKRVESETEEEPDLKEVRRGRSRSRARSKILDAQFDDNASEKEKPEHIDLELVKTSPPPRRSARSKPNVKIPLYGEDSDVDESPVLQRKSRSRPLKGRKTFEIKNDGSYNELHRKSEKLRESKKANDEYEIVVIDSDESEGSGKEKSKLSNKISDEELEADIVIEESESESEKVPKTEQRKPRRRIKSINYDDDSDIEENKSKKNSESRSKNKISENKKATEDDLNENIGRNFEFVIKRRGKSNRIADDEILDKDIDTNEGIDESVKERLSVKQIPPHSPVVNKKEERKAAKSVKKSTKERKPSGQETTGKSKMNIADKLDSEKREKQSVTPARETGKKSSRTTGRSTKKATVERLPEQTPVLKENKSNNLADKLDSEEREKQSVSPAPETGKKSSRTTGRSTKKATVERLPEQTPVLKENKSNNLVSEKPNTLELLKKRLTMVGNKHIVKEDTNADVRKRPQGDVGRQEREESASPVKRSKRSKNPVNYKPKPLNVKLRQGDDMFEDQASGMSKVRAEQRRLLIAKKMTVPKIIINDKENLTET